MNNETLQKLLQPPFHENQRLIIGLSKNREIRQSQSGDEQLAEILYKNKTLTVRDLGGSLPVTINGVEGQGRTILADGHSVQIGQWIWTVDLPRRYGISISLRDVQYNVSTGWGLKKNITLLHHINLDIKSGEFIGIVGLSGSGKSTLIRVLNGDYKPDGIVAFNNYAADDFLQNNAYKMAYLPQELILHNELTSRQALMYSAKLRNIPDPQKIVESVLLQVGMLERADVIIRNLSGGQKKRIALASELLNNPDALFLDEATSGLDPASEKEMMTLFRQLANNGITTICITHFPANLILCDKLIVVNHGTIAYNGTPKDAMRYFGIDSIDEIYSVLQKIPEQKTFSQQLPPVRITATEKETTSDNSFIADFQASGRQLPTLLQRYWRILFSDGKNVLFLLLQAPIIAGLIGLTFGNILIDFAEQHASDWKQVAFLLLLSIVWCSSTNGVREIVKERHIFQHERRYRLNPVSYLFSKFILLGIIGIFQSWLMLWTLHQITGVDVSLTVSTITVALMALAGSALGLFVSSFSKTSEQAVTLLPVLVIAQAVYSGGLARMTGLNQIAAMLLASTFWGLEAFKTMLPPSLFNATFPGAPGHYQPPILGMPFALHIDLIAILLQTALLLTVSFILLKLKRKR
ncbi:MAG: ATP-binding cassette domain-containing protein [Planctomycetaceae bacterium]|nr:ATP-binding cassette domain-containing protein [Planctomycetaceae bacterium]